MTHVESRQCWRLLLWSSCCVRPAEPNSHVRYPLAAGVDDRAASDRLGHADPAYTKRDYVHGVADAQQRAAQAADDLLMKSGRFLRTGENAPALGNMEPPTRFELVTPSLQVRCSAELSYGGD